MVSLDSTSQTWSTHTSRLGEKTISNNCFLRYKLRQDCVHSEIALEVRYVSGGIELSVERVRRLLGAKARWG